MFNENLCLHFKCARTNESGHEAEYNGPEVEAPVAPSLHRDDELYELETQIQEDDGLTKIPTHQY